ncbi:MAG: 23S rRNA (pseudouridine(1915)-N(3))-methyltransferase RlmH [Betaproteobacteria bacterium]
MPRLHVVALDARLPGWAEQACAEYARRMPRGYELLRKEVKKNKLKSALPKGARLVALDERGRDLDTRAFSKLLLEETVFLIGGPDGLDEALKKEAALLVRLSSLTLPHALAQVLLLEQLYRAATLLTGHPYHRV